MKRMITLFLMTALLTACTLVPHYERPASPVPSVWPSDARAPASASLASADQIGWRDFFTDPRLVRLIEIGLQNNRNLRIAVLNVAASQAQFRVQRGALFPSISATGSEFVEKFPTNGAFPLSGLGASGGGSTLVPTGAGSSTFRYFNAGIGFTNYELDLFGRERSLTTEAFEQYLSQYESRRSTQISLVAEVATDYFAVLADRALVRLTQDTLQNETESYELTKAMYDRDTTTLLALRQAESAVDAARASLQQYERQLAQDAHALALVLGQEIPEDLPDGRDIEHEGLLEVLPAGLPADLLVRRPDIASAEHALRAANADIGAARAAFLPSIQLTGSGGTASTRLSALFGKGSGTWTFAPTLSLPLFTGGQNRANLDLAHLEKNVAIARYELVIQTAFREVSDALSARGTYVGQLEAQRSLVDADADAYRLAQLRFRSGIDSYLSTLDAQRSLYAAQQSLVSLRQAQLTNQVTLYKALGGGWVQRTAGHSPQ